MLGSLLTLLFVVAFNFFLFRVVQSDPVATLFRGRNISDETRAELEREFGLDKSTSEQFVLYLRETAQLNLGVSYQSQRAVWQEISEAIPNTVILVGTSAVLSAVIGTVAGIVAAWRRRTAADYTLTSSTMVLYSMPDFWLGMLLMSVFAVSLGWFPIGGVVDPGTDPQGWERVVQTLHHLVLPAATLTLA
ncbi:MAG TPA: ABC transporter permease, partial [Acidimicrobiia bacterium]